MMNAENLNTPAHEADVETSSANYASRFSGVAGTWLLSVQARIFIQLLRRVLDSSNDSITLLDAGGGHGQILEAVSAANLLPRCKITIVGSEASCAERLQPAIDRGDCRFDVASLTALPYDDRSFDIVTSFRFIPHCDAWQQHIRELARIARRAVIVDYPAYASVNCISPLLFKLKKKLEGNTRTYTLFSHAEIASAFSSAGFGITQRRGEFLFPMVVHRMLKNAQLSNALEAPFSALGITNAFGSPIIVLAEPT